MNKEISIARRSLASVIFKIGNNLKENEVLDLFIVYVKKFSIDSLESVESTIFGLIELELIKKYNLICVPPVSDILVLKLMPFIDEAPIDYQNKFCKRLESAIYN